MNPIKKIIMIIAAITFLTNVVIAEDPADLKSNKVDNSSRFTLSGKIYDKDTGTPIPFVTVGIPSLGIGTASNPDGEWSLQLPATAAGRNLYFKSMGYTPRLLKIDSTNDTSVIYLSEANFELGQVIIMPDSTLKHLLRSAYNNISKNYPKKATLCTGFYRETQKFNDTLFLYFNEAVLKVYKNTYKNNKNYGQIEIEKSRKNIFPDIDSINDVKFYGGPHFPNELDIVFSRWDFINPSKYKDWKYNLEGIYKDSISGEETYLISFKNKKRPNSDFSGNIYIDKQNLAYTGFDMEKSGPGTFEPAISPKRSTYLPGKTSIKIRYTKYNDKYNLGHIYYKTNGINTEKMTRIHKDIEYVTTSIKTDSVSPIPYSKQFRYTDILLLDGEEYSKSFWKDYNILKESRVLDRKTTMLYNNKDAVKQLQKKYPVKLSKQDKTLLFLKKFSFETSIMYTGTKINNGTHSFIYKGTSSEYTVKNEPVTLSVSEAIRYEINRRWYLNTNVSTALYGISNIKLNIGGIYRIPLTNKGIKTFMDAGLSLSGNAGNNKLSSMKNTTIKGESFDGHKINIYAKEKSLGLTPSLSFSIKLGKKYELFTDLNYYFPLLQKEYLQFKENKGFFKKKINVNWDDRNLIYTINNKTRTKSCLDISPLSIKVGIRSGF